MYLKTKTGKRVYLPSTEEDVAITVDAMADPDTKPYTDEEWEAAKPTMRLGGKSLGGRPKSLEKMEPVTLRLKPSVAAYWRATGKGWQTRLQQVIEQYAADHPLQH